MSSTRPPNQDQVSPLPGLRRFITGHDSSTGRSILEQEASPIAPWQSFENGQMGFTVIYTTSESPVDVNSDADLARHHQVVTSGTLGLVNPGGNVCRIVDMAPGYITLFHRTQSLDYGVVLEGEVELLLDENYDVQTGQSPQDPPVMRRGDVAVQRETMHGWRNHSQTEWARMLFVLTDARPLTVAGRELREDLGAGLAGLPSSGHT
jgi:hypothetical protein